TSLFGSSNERRMKKLGFVRDRLGATTIVPGSLLDRINSLESEWQKLSDEDLRQTASKFRARLQSGETLDDLLPEAFAAVRESARRYLKMRHYEVQMIGGYILHKGMIAEMMTGEGKTLVSSLPAFLNALVGKVHVVTVNDYLALRDMEWMGPIHINLGLTVGAIQSNMGSAERQVHYARDITYGTSNQFGFDYLRDNMKPTKEQQVQGPLDFAIVDEIDNILIDEARTPLIISGPAHDNLEKYPRADAIARQLRKDTDFEVKEKEHTCHLTEEGVRRAEQLAGVESFYTAGNMEWPHLLDNALKAHHLYKRDVNYVVEKGEVVIVDENTGRKMEGRQWSDGLHQAVEAKEGVKIKEESQTLATITLQNYFKLYRKLAGMTGTAMTEAEEFLKIYNLDVVSIPTNRPMKRINHPDNIYGTEKEKWDAVVTEVAEVHATGRPLLVGTTSIELSEMLSNRLVRKGIRHNVLNAKYHEREAEIVAQAGRQGAVTIATNMAGRGTDIILGGNPEHLAWEELKTRYASRLDVPKSEWDALTRQIAEREGMISEGKVVAELGGLHVVGTERHDSRRIDLQLRGRAGRQGDPGSSRFFISLDDKLMRLFAGDTVKRIMQWAGLREGEPIVSSMVTRRIEGAQKKREEQHFDQRKNLLEYDEVMDEQRKRTYSFRQQILDGVDCRAQVLKMMNDEIDRWTKNFLAKDYRWETVAAWVNQNLQLAVEASDIRNMTREELENHLREDGERQGETQIYEQIAENLPEDADSRLDWNWMALTKWANRTFGLSLQDKDLRKHDRNDLGPFLFEQARQGMSRWNLKDLDAFLDPQFIERSLAGWANHSFLLGVKPEELSGLDERQTAEFLKKRVLDHYNEKEVTFPISVGMQNFLTGDGKQNERFNREKLARWANTRFRAAFNPEQFADLQTEQIYQTLAETSRQFAARRPDAAKIDARLTQILGDASESSMRVSEQQVQNLLQWIEAEQGLELNADRLRNMTAGQVRTELLQGIEQLFRPEMRQTERSVLLEFLDTAWKEHLYQMGLLKQGINFVGYAQKDPRTEYKREGRRTFLAMWERIAEQVTQTIFRIEHESPHFVGSLWKITATEHDVAPPVDSEIDQLETNAPEAGEEGRAVKPIVNAGPRVGRNDDCPCGSGKKYKKCCGR
ncbi:MAG: preprotein translocase subunit SecA, partial [Planctomycetota bacterium]